MTYRDAKQLVEGFENGTLPAAEWTHKAHFVMALWYTFYFPVADARRRIKEGIKVYNVATGGRNTEDSGYHETITELYIRTIVHYQLSFAGHYDFQTLLDNLEGQPFLERNFPFNFYSKEFLMSREARKNWVEPDIRPLDLITPRSVMNAV